MRLLVILHFFLIGAGAALGAVLHVRRDGPVKPLGRGVFEHVADTTASTGRRNCR